MNLKQKIEEWEKTKKEISPWPWATDYVNEHPTFMNCQRVISKNPEIEVAAISSDIESKADTYFISCAPENYDVAMQALKESFDFIINCTEETIHNLPIVQQQILRKWGFEK